MRRILQASGAEVIHLGHNRSVQEIVNAALQEDVQGVAITSYQGGHLEFFKYMVDLLRRNGGESCCGATDMMRCSNDDAPMQNAALWPKRLTPPGDI